MSATCVEKVDARTSRRSRAALVAEIAGQASSANTLVAGRQSAGRRRRGYAGASRRAMHAVNQDKRSRRRLRRSLHGDLSVPDTTVRRGGPATRQAARGDARDASPKRRCSIVRRWAHGARRALMAEPSSPGRRGSRTRSCAKAAPNPATTAIQNDQPKPEHRCAAGGACHEGRALDTATAMTAAHGNAARAETPKRHAHAVTYASKASALLPMQGITSPMYAGRDRSMARG